MRKQTKLKLLERDVHCLRILKTVNRAAAFVRLIACASVCAVVALDMVRIVRK